MKSVIAAAGWIGFRLMFLLATSHAGYYSSDCFGCSVRTGITVESDYIYSSSRAARNACENDCSSGCGTILSGNDLTCMDGWLREACRTGMDQVASNVSVSTAETENEVTCKFGEAEVDQCVSKAMIASGSCQTSCLPVRNNQGLYKYYSSTADYEKWTIWGKCQKWPCEYCDHNRLACINNIWCQYYGNQPTYQESVCSPGHTYYPNEILPHGDEETEAALKRNCPGDDDCFGIERWCTREWAVCHHWCDISQIPKCDEDKERCINTCVCGQAILCPIPNNVGRHVDDDDQRRERKRRKMTSINELPPWTLECLDDCHAQWDDCVASGDYTDACPVELTIESGGRQYGGANVICPGISFYSAGGEHQKEEFFCNPPDNRWIRTLKFWLPGYFRCSLSEFRLIAPSSWDGWLIRKVSIRVGPHGDFIDFNLTSPWTGASGIWLDKENYNGLMEKYRHYPYNKEWAFHLDRPASFPKHSQFEVIFVGDHDVYGGSALMTIKLSVYPVGSSEPVSKELSFNWDYSALVYAVVEDTEDFFATGGIEKFVLETSDTDGWFIRRIAANFHGSFEDIDLTNANTGGTGIWLDGKPFGSPQFYGEYDFSDSYTFPNSGGYEKGA